MNLEFRLSEIPFHSMCRLLIKFFFRWRKKVGGTKVVALQRLDKGGTVYNVAEDCGVGRVNPD